MRNRLILAALLMASAAARAQYPAEPRAVGLPESPRIIGLPDTPRSVDAPDTPAATPQDAPPARRSAPAPLPAKPPGTSTRTAGPGEIELPGVLAVELPRGVAQADPAQPPLRDLLASARGGNRTVTSDLRRNVGVGPVRVTFSAWDGKPGSGKPAITHTVRLFILPFGMTPVAMSGHGNATGGNNAAHIARDTTGKVHMIWQEGGRGAHEGPVYRRAAVTAQGVVRWETAPVQVAGETPSDWNAYPSLAVSGRDVQLVWQGGGTAHTRRVSAGRDGVWSIGPVVDTGAKSEGRDVGDSMVFDSRGGLHLVTPNGVYAYSLDGLKWRTEQIPLPPDTRVKTQSVTVDGAGVVHVAASLPVTRPDPPGQKLGGYWQLRVFDRTASGWSTSVDVLANRPGWTEPRNGDDVLADWVRIAADARGGLHLTWHGTALSRKYANDTAFYAWKKPGGAWSAPVALVRPDPAQNISFSYAPSLTLEGERALALTFFDTRRGEDWGFDASLVPLRNGQMAGPPLTVTRFVHDAIAAGRPDTAMGPRFPVSAPVPFHAPDGKVWLDLLETIQSPFEPAGPNVIVYHRIDLTGRF